MKLFGGLKSISPTFDVQRAVMTIIVAAIKADGEIADEEIVRLRSMCARSPIFANNSKSEDDAVIDFANNVSSQLGDDVLPRAASALKPELRETAFAFAIEMVLADGMVGREEEAYITKLAEVLKISEDVGSAIVNVTMIRLRGA